MDVTDIPLFALADRRLDWIDRRSSVLAANIANADTPGYRPRDLPPFAAALGDAGGGPAASLAPARTNPLHLVGTAPAMDAASASAAPRAPDGNAVSLDQQLTRVADTDAAHQFVTDLYRSYLGMFRTAIGH